ncbi:MAG: hypothetical protein QF615_08155, partial [Planctomycetota bacterium]|nr:hypothetical protein [Planctomycetota bacterium]
MAHAAPTSAARIRVPWAWLVALAVLVWAVSAWHLDFICDDAFISFRYAKHLAAGEGLVFNLGSHQPVEGYTNFLWVVYLSLFEPGGYLHTRFLDTPTIARLSSGLCGLILLLQMAAYLRRRPDLSDAARAAGLLFLATFPPMALWSSGGLATMPVALFIFLAFRTLLDSTGLHTDSKTGPAAIAERRFPGIWTGIWAGLWGVLAVLTRADGFLWIAGICLLAALSPRCRERSFRRSLFTFATLTALALAVHFSWRHNYYGEWLPNTARVKTGLSALRLERGAKYVLAYLCAVPSAGLALACA